MPPALATIDMQLAICAGDVKITTWFVPVILLLRLETTTPGMARKPTFTESTTVDCDIVRVKHKDSSLGAAQTYRENQLFPFFQQPGNEVSPIPLKDDVIYPHFLQFSQIALRCQEKQRGE